jgi:glutamyl-Q tRNA(Asp) synthetase
VAAVGSWLLARREDGRWLVRIEDLDRSRVIPGAADEILSALERYGLNWDGAVVHQSRRRPVYDAALQALRADGLLFDCACSRAELRRVASAPDRGEDGEPVYPGTCRLGLPPGRPPRAVRFRAPHGRLAFIDQFHGTIAEDVATVTGDFVVRRADGPYAYQLAVVVDDAAQGVTQVVRGSDLLHSTPRQIALQHALRLPTPSYAHLPMVTDADGRKLGKRHGALPLPSLGPAAVRRSLRQALALLGARVTEDAPERMLAEALERWDPDSVPVGSCVAGDGPPGPTGG